MTKFKQKNYENLMTKFIFLITYCLLVSCVPSKESLPPTSSNKSHYHIHRFEKIQESDSAIIKLAAFDIDDHRIGLFTIEVNGRPTYYSKADEPIVIVLEPDNYFFRFNDVGYDSLTTHTFF